MKRRVFIVALGVLTAACHDAMCLDSRCIPTLEIRFAQPIAFPYRVELAIADSVVRVVECAAGRQCSTTSVVFDQAPAHATVKVVTVTGQVTTIIAPVYASGPGCASECLHGTVTVAVPAP